MLLWLPVYSFATLVTSSIKPGLNVTAVTAALVAGQQTAFTLLTDWKTSGVIAIESYDVTSGKLLRTELDGNGNPTGVDFTLVEDKALYVYSSQQSTLSLGDNTSCAPLNLFAGFNLAGYACFPADYQASEFITSIGLANISSLSRLDPSSGRWQTAAVSGGTTIVGDDFPLIAGEGYLIQSAAVSGWTSSSIGLTPATMTVQQGQPGAVLTLSIPTTAPSGGTVINLVSSDPTLVAVAAQITVPQGSSSVSVPLTAPDTGSTAIQTATVTASRSGMVSTQATLSVHPKPTINLSPLTAETGLDVTFPAAVTVNLSDVAPSGGFPVTLAASPTGIVSVPTSVTVPAGASSTQATITAIALGNATISATSPGRGISGSQQSVTVKATQSATYNSQISPQIGVQVGPVFTAPTSVSATYTPVYSREVGVQVGPVFTGPSPIQTANYGPLTSSPVGVQVGDNAIAATSVIANYNPVISTEVGVAVGPVVTAVSPNHGGIGDSAIPLTITGYGLNAVTGIAFLPATGITVGALSVASDGLSVTVPIDIAANAAVGARTVLVSTASGVIKASSGGADIFNVTLQIPEIASIYPLRSMVGQSVTMIINGKNFTSATSVNFTPSTGITVSNPPTVNAGGTTITVSFTIASGATLGDRVVTVTAPGGTCSATASVTNTFSLTATTDPGYTHTSVTSEVGVLVQTSSAATTQSVNYGPTTSMSVGVTVGSTITAVAPISGNIGSSNLVVRVTGVGLSSASAISFYPPDGITIKSFAIVGGNPEVTIDIASSAAVTPLTVLVALSTGGYALPTDAGSNQFRVTLQVPTITSLQPIRAMVGQSVAMTIIGTNFGSASSVDFTPSTGITVVNPPTVNSDGTMITTNLTIAANATLGDRVVTVTTPGGTTSATASTVNSFSVTSDAGITYTPLLSQEVGVLVSTASVSNVVVIGYGPVSSPEVGVMVTPTAAATSQTVNYGPLVSTEIGVAVGGVFTGFSLGAMEPGSSATFTLTGVGLGSVTAVTVVPSANLTVTAWTPASDGLSGTVTISADSGAVQGKRTLVPMVGSSALTPSVAGIDILQVGYKPIVNSITTTFPASSVLAKTGSTVTLTINGSYLQGVTKVEVIPTDGITIDTVPIWSNVGGEHVSVTIVVAANAQLGDRQVKLTSSYGSSGATLGVSNTLKIVDTVADIAPVGADTCRVAANEPPVEIANDYLTVARIMELYGLSGRKLDVTLLASQQLIATNMTEYYAHGILMDRLISLAGLPDVSRGPPGV